MKTTAKMLLFFKQHKNKQKKKKEQKVRTTTSQSKKGRVGSAPACGRGMIIYIECPQNRRTEDAIRKQNKTTQKKRETSEKNRTS